jgi:hypothetical protein
MQPIGATHDRRSLAFEAPTIQLQAAYAATCHVLDKNLLQRPVRSAAEMRRRWPCMPAFIALKMLAGRLIARTGCMPPNEARPTKLPSCFRPQSKRTNAILACLDWRCAVWAKSDGDALMKPVRKGASGPGDAVSATDAACNAAFVFAALTGIQVTEVRLRKQGRRRDRNSRGVG